MMIWLRPHTLDVADALREAGFHVTELIADERDDPAVNAAAVMNALFSREYRIVHIAAHGVYDDKRPAASGVIIGDELYLIGTDPVSGAPRAAAWHPLRICAVCQAHSRQSRSTIGPRPRQQRDRG